MGHLLSGSFDGCFGSVYLLWSVFINTDCNKSGQTSGLATGAQIYRQVVTVKKTYIAILAFWIVSVVGAPASTAIREYVHYIGRALSLFSHHNRRLLKNFLPSTS